MNQHNSNTNNPITFDRIAEFLNSFERNENRYAGEAG